MNYTEQRCEKMSKQRIDGKENMKNNLMRHGYRIQCLSNRDLLVEGCKGILKYEVEEIGLNVGDGQVVITGKNLNIPVLERNFVQIQGVILQIEFI